MRRAAAERLPFDDDAFDAAVAQLVVHFMAEPVVEPVDSGTTGTAEGEWRVTLPVAGRPIEAMMVKEHEPFLDELLANLKKGIEAKAAA